MQLLSKKVIKVFLWFSGISVRCLARMMNVTSHENGLYSMEIFYTLSDRLCKFNDEQKSKRESNLANRVRLIKGIVRVISNCEIISVRFYTCVRDIFEKLFERGSKTTYFTIIIKSLKKATSTHRRYEYSTFGIYWFFKSLMTLYNVALLFTTLWENRGYQKSLSKL